MTPVIGARPGVQADYQRFNYIKRSNQRTEPLRVGESRNRVFRRLEQQRLKTDQNKATADGLSVNY